MSVKEPTDDCVAIEFSADANEPNRWQSKDGEWHTGKIPTKTERLKKKVEGEWIDYVSGANWATCSVCGRSNKILKRWKYCPECGTEMKGIKEKTWK